MINPTISPCVLVAPLNWGLGHATRCIPLIKALEEQGVQVILASDGDALHLLRAEFPHLIARELPSYRIRYASNNMVRNIASQLPRILYAIRAEHQTCAHLVRQYNINGIISDNRYGCFNAKAHSVLLTHQLNLRVPNKALQWLANALLRHALRPFEAIWVPDAADAPNLSGDLSHPLPEGLPPVQYLGLLSRMKPAKAPLEIEYDVAVVLSGPEPQRSVLEQRLLEEALMLSDKRIIVIQGKTAAKEHHLLADHLEMVSYLTSAEINEVLLKSKAIVCRSGYSSLMDLAALGQKALLIPTPGQTEQEYLAEHLAAQGVMPMQSQDAIQLQSGLKILKHSKGFANASMGESFGEVLDKWVGMIGEGV